MIRIVFPGDPVAQARCRYFKRGNRICVFDPQTLYKKKLKALAQDQVYEYNISKSEEWQKPDYPSCTFWYFMPIPKSMSKKDREFAETERLRHDKKPDVDNLLKLHLDVLAQVVINDDNAVEIRRATKVYSPNPRTLVFIDAASKLLTNTDMYGP